MLADQVLGLAPVVLAGQHAGLDHRAGQFRQQRERRGQAADRVAERLVVRERVVERAAEAVGDARRDRAVEELDPEALGQRGADLAPAGAVGRGDGDERRRGAEVSPADDVHPAAAPPRPRRRSRTSSPTFANGSIVTASPSRLQTPAITPSTSSTGENQPPGR